MILALLVCAVCTVAAGGVLPDEATSQITDYESNDDGSGNYYFRFKTSNGITREETGQLVNAGTEEQYIKVEGSFSYIDSDGIPVVSKYTADQNGYHTNGQQSSLPDLGEIVGVGLPPNIAATLLGR